MRYVTGQKFNQILLPGNSNHGAVQFRVKEPFPSLRGNGLFGSELGATINVWKKIMGLLGFMR
jgi:hypothetical protein